MNYRIEHIKDRLGAKNWVFILTIWNSELDYCNAEESKSRCKTRNELDLRFQDLLLGLLLLTRNKRVMQRVFLIM
jgi:hypothetical protein